ncbi:MAG: hypothetical protein R3E01_36000 [Pirellulaceae bacterium]
MSTSTTVNSLPQSLGIAMGPVDGDGDTVDGETSCVGVALARNHAIMPRFTNNDRPQPRH